MPSPIDDIVSELNKDAGKKPTSITTDIFRNITVDGPNILCIDFVKYRLAVEMKHDKSFRGLTIDHKSYNKILKNTTIRKHYLEKKLEKYKDK